ncbi:hypothetical protein MLD38_006938 [Melastoma candidum]|uniref:Uncharacterized protein n=1 Tax=Melastoma candidum TaxID=119954 RepID=A0ACB9RP10_9MYRT|nr:hypothetical protein MLD38_006938 [Melastoma candidum]
MMQAADFPERLVRAVEEVLAVDFVVPEKFSIIANQSRKCISSRLSSDHLDTDAVRRVLESCRQPSDFRNAAAAHGKIIKAGCWSHLSIVASQILAYLRCRHIDSVARAVRRISNGPDNILRINLVLRSLMVSGEFRAAQKMFDELSVRDVVTWNTMIGGLVKNGKFEEAISKFHHMLGEKAEPDGFTFASVFTACARIGVSSRALWVHKLMIEKRVHPNFILNAALIDMYSRCGKIQLAREVFDRVPREDVSVWNAMINGLAIHGLGQDAVALFSRMEAECVSPDAITFVSVLTACGCCGLVNEGRQYFHRMKSQYSIDPELEHYGAMVHLLARAGLLDEAYAMANAMPMRPDPVIWRMGKCREAEKPNETERNPEKLRQKLDRDGRHGASFYSWG